MTDTHGIWTTGSDRCSGNPSHQTGKVRLSVSIASESGRVYLKLTYQLKHADAFRSQGYELGFDEILLENVDGSNRRVTDWLNSNTENTEAIEVEETEQQLIVKGVRFCYTYDKLHGIFGQLEADGKSITGSTNGSECMAGADGQRSDYL